MTSYNMDISGDIMMAGKRELNKAKIRLELVTELEKRLRNDRYENIRLTEMCKAVGISKVTFFKYYSSKEELLRYYFRIWCLLVCKSLEEQPKKGLSGVYFVIDQLIKKMQELPFFFYAYYSYVVGDSRVRAPFTIKNTERNLLGDNLNEVQIRSIAQLIDSFILEAVFENEISVQNPKEISGIINTYIVGSIVEASMNNLIPSPIEVSQKIQVILKPYQDNLSI